MRVALNLNGGVSERLKVTVLKTVEPERVPWVRIPPPPPATQKLIDYGELAESVEGARLLSEYTGQNLYRGFESLALRHCALIAQLDRVFGYEPKGRRFESCWAHHAGTKFTLLRRLFISMAKTLSACFVLPLASA